MSDIWDNRCADCRYFHPAEAFGGSGMCLRYPASIGKLSAETCGEFKEKE